ncbi:MAG: peptidoglycan-binding protein [Reyranella sp.]|nr:MAG: peptidoglycan-binding protein [Reyranella sp.]
MSGIHGGAWREASMVTRVEKPAVENGRADEAFKESLAAFEQQLDRRFKDLPLSRPEPVGRAAAIAERPARAVLPTLSRFPVVMVSAAVAAASVSILVMQLLKTAPVTAAPSPAPAVALRPPSATDVVPPPPPPAAPVMIESRAAPAPQPAAKAEPPTPPAPRDRGRLNAGEVREVQARLAILGFNPGPADGAAGPQTSAAVRRFEEATGRPPTGAVDREIWTQLRNEPALQQAGR